MQIDGCRVACASGDLLIKRFKKNIVPVYFKHWLITEGSLERG